MKNVAIDMFQSSSFQRYDSLLSGLGGVASYGKQGLKHEGDYILEQWSQKLLKEGTIQCLD